MLSLDALRQLLKRPDMPDAEAEAARTLLTTLADLLIDDYLADRDPFRPDDDQRSEP